MEVRSLVLQSRGPALVVGGSWVGYWGCGHWDIGSGELGCRMCLGKKAERKGGEEGGKGEGERREEIIFRCDICMMMVCIDTIASA